jgi:hypothetical protein
MRTFQGSQPGRRDPDGDQEPGVSLRGVGAARESGQAGRKAKEEDGKVSMWAGAQNLTEEPQSPALQHVL